jgi:hypothetical protein
MPLPPAEEENGVDQLARCGLPWSPTNPRIRDHGRSQLPLNVGEIGIVAPPRWQLPLRHRASARVVSPTPYESHQATLGILLKRALTENGQFERAQVTSSIDFRIGSTGQQRVDPGETQVTTAVAAPASGLVAGDDGKS